MKQIVVLSGKGGTGKTTVASGLIKLLGARNFADCDVDAPNLHLLYNSENTVSTDFYGMEKASINNNLCVGCLMCKKYCKFDAIQIVGDEVSINKYNCEGCGVCSYVCPQGAISMTKQVAGKLSLSKGERVFSSAELKMGEGTSGKLVTEVKRNLKNNLISDDIAIIDGSPGIGCPVIASISGATAVLIVAEPTISGISDMVRIVKTAKGFGVKVLVCVNKYDISLANTSKIEQYCTDNNLVFTGKIPYDKNAVKLINEGKTIVDEDSISGNELKKICKNIVKCLEGI